MTGLSNQTHQPEPKDADHSVKNESFPHASSPDTLSNGGESPSSREAHLEDRIHEVLEQKLISLLDNESTNREILWLRRQVNWSIGFLVVLILMFGGAFTWFAYLMRTNPPNGQTGVSSTIGADRLENLETQVQQLSDRLPEDLSGTLTSNQEQLQTLSEQISALSSDVDKNQQTLTNLDVSIQDLEDALLLKEEESSSTFDRSSTSE